VAVAARSFAPLVGFGATEDCAYRLLDEQPLPAGSRFRFRLPRNPGWLRGLVAATPAEGDAAARLGEEELAARGRARLALPEDWVEVEAEAGLSGAYNGRNILAALAVVEACGGDRARVLALLKDFAGPARRMDRYDGRDGLLLYDDFGHHPTAVREALAALRRRHPERFITALVEPRSNTSVRNVMQEAWTESLGHADAVLMGALHRPWKYDSAELFDFAALAARLAQRGIPFRQEDDPAALAAWLQGVLAGDCPDPLWRSRAPRDPARHLWVIFSNGSFGGLLQHLLGVWRA
jgi:UDP-N-acetylmuramate-alanine ligase